jgi:hypothetical protein
MRAHSIILLFLLQFLQAFCDCDKHESDCLRDGAIDEQDLGMALLQKQMQLQSASSDLPSQPVELQQAPQKESGKLLIMILSCWQNEWMWTLLFTWVKHVHPDGDALILVGRQGETMDKTYELNISYEKQKHYGDGLLIVNASDTYDGLAVKIISGIAAIYNAPELAQYTHVYKIDDSSIQMTDFFVQRDYSPLHVWSYDKRSRMNPDQIKKLPGDVVDFSIIGFNATEVEAALTSQPADYMTAEFGYKAVDCAALDPKLMEYHFGRVPETSYWNNRRQPCKWIYTYANGAFGYILSRRAMGLVAKHWPLESMDELFHQFIYEDMAVAITLMEEGVSPTPVHLKGHTPWNIRVCPCAPTNPDASCDSYCDAHKSGRCCHQVCRQNQGLCTDVLYA